jgi:hypothetical protein
VVAGSEQQVRGALGDLPMRALYVRVVQPGRTTCAIVHGLLEAEPGLDIKRADALHRAAVAAVAARHAPAIVDVVFTPSRKSRHPLPASSSTTPMAPASPAHPLSNVSRELRDCLTLKSSTSRIGLRMGAPKHAIET